VIDRSSVVACRPDVLSTFVGDEVVLLDVERGKYFGLNSIGADVWRALASPTKIEDLLTGLMRDYEGDATVIEKDVVDLIGRLADSGLVRVS
jgi:hypothetical protein